MKQNKTPEKASKKETAQSSSDKMVPHKTKKTSRRTKERKDFFIVGIRASAKGLDAFERFFQSMQSESGMAFILITHLFPTHHSIMPDLLRKYNKMGVCRIDDGMHTKPKSLRYAPPH